MWVLPPKPAVLGVLDEVEGEESELEGGHGAIEVSVESAILLRSGGGFYRPQPVNERPHPLPYLRRSPCSGRLEV